MMEDTSPVQHPREMAGFFSLLTFSWMGDVLKRGARQPLEEKDLFPVEISNQAERLTGDLEREWLAEERASEQNRTKPRLWRAMMRVTSYREYIPVLLLRFCYTITYNILPLIVWFFLRGISENSYKKTLPFVIGISVVTISRSVSYGHAIFKLDLMAIRLKAAVIGLVYKKVSDVSLVL